MSAPPVPVDERGPLGEDRSVWVFVLGDMTVFALFFVVTVVERRRDRVGFAAAADDLLLPVGLVNTLALLTGSYLVVLAVRAHRDGVTRRAARLLRGATATAALFVALKAVEYTRYAWSGPEPAAGASSAFVALYVVVTGLHLLHVLIGSALLEAWRRRAAGGEPWSDASPAGRLTGATAIYWHMVDLLWLVIVALLYVVARVP